MNVRRLTDDELVFAIFRKVAAAPRKLAGSFNAVLSYLGTDPPDGAAMAAEAELDQLMRVTVADYLLDDQEYVRLRGEAERRHLDLNDWHLRRAPDEPACGPGQWRTRDRAVVVTITAMTARHLAGAERYAVNVPYHRSRHVALAAELRRRYHLEGQPE